MKKLYNLVAKLYDTEVPAQGLALFRILYGIVFFAETCQMYYFKELIFDPIPFISPAEIDMGLPLTVWLFVIFLLTIGAFTRYVSIINYMFSLVAISSIHFYEYHIDYSYTAINFLLMFVPSSRAFSVDRLFEKLKYSTLKIAYNPPKTVSVLSYLSIVGLGIGLIYFDSLFYKLASPMWLNGLGFWMPTSIPFATYLDFSFILNIKWLAYFLGYLTLLFEAVFLFGMWKRKYRIPLVILGVGLHVGILFAYPIPWFALAVIALYVLMLPYEWWPALHDKVKAKTHSLVVYYDEECPLCNRIKIITTHFDFFAVIRFKGVQSYASSDNLLKDVSQEALLGNIYSIDSKGRIYHGLGTYVQIFSRIWFLWPISILLRLPLISHLANKVYAYITQNRFREVCNEENFEVKFPATPQDYDHIKLLNNFYVKNLKVAFIVIFIIHCTIGQLFSVTRSLLVNDITAALFPKNYFLGQVRGFTKKCAPFYRKTLGITAHNVFIDRIHFEGYNHMLSVAYVDEKGKETWLPIIDKNGQVGTYNTGRQWKGWLFITVGRQISNVKLNYGVRAYTAFWAKKHGVSLDKKAVFKLRVKKFETPNGWQDNHLRNQMAQPWIDAGTGTWENNNFTLDVLDIESL